MTLPPRPPDGGLYDPSTEHDACGVGFVADIRGRASNEIVRMGIRALTNLLHRGAKGSEENTGDGAGVLVQIPDRFFRRALAARFGLPPPGDYGVGMFHLPRDPSERAACVELVECNVAKEGQILLGWRDVPTSDGHLGKSAVAAEPAFRQVFIARRDVEPGDAFERRLFLIRKRSEGEVLRSGMAGRGLFYPATLSSRTIAYKGMLSADQMDAFFPDLLEPDVESAIALFHQRFSTNTFPNWELAHPFRILAHNGEINTIRGNVRRMLGREKHFKSELFPDEDMEHLLPIIRQGASDSASLDNVLEFLVQCGRSIPHALMMMIPEAHAGQPSMDDARKAFYEYHASLLEPWDGPAAVAFTDGRVAGAMLDRNGLRPSRYWVTKDGLVILASEAGVVSVPPERIERKGRLEPGRMLLVDTLRGRIRHDDEVKREVALAHPYREWISRFRVHLRALEPDPPEPASSPDVLVERQRIFGYTREDLRMLLAPMASRGDDPVGSMGTDTPLAVLSERPRVLFDYFHQLFAQVTNPPLDAIREECVTSVSTGIGPEGFLLEPIPGACRQILADSPVLSNEDLSRLKALAGPRFIVKVLHALFPAAEGAAGLERALEGLFREASRAVAEDVDVLILSDRGANREHVPIPSLLATASLHHHLIRQGERTRVGLVVESGEAREVHHVCLLQGYGAGAVNPWLALDTVDDLARRNALPAGVDPAKASRNYRKALTKGVLKVISRMGISTVHSYRGAQIFECVGLGRDVIDRFFTGTTSRIGGIGLSEIAREAVLRHRIAVPDRPEAEPTLESGGQFHWRRDGEFHLMNPASISALQRAVRTNDPAVYREYAAIVNDVSTSLCTLRGLLRFRPGTAVPLEEVEPASEIVKRFVTGAMSYGSISREAHETLAIAMNRLGGKSNSGEGGEDPERDLVSEHGDARGSAVRQVASGRFGVSSAYLSSARELQIKIAQGAKPGEGGQ
ncbi:MAG: glutamate synthase central domain-containing protein, partial [Planctomycetota bacterium]